MNANDNVQIDRLIGDVIIDVDDISMSRGDMLQHSLQAWIRYATAKGFSDFEVATALSRKMAAATDRLQVVVDPEDDQPIL